MQVPAGVDPIRVGVIVDLVGSDEKLRRLDLRVAPQIAPSAVGLLFFERVQIDFVGRREIFAIGNAGALREENAGRAEQAPVRSKTKF